MSTLTTAIKARKVKNQCLQHGKTKEEGLKWSEVGWLSLNFLLFLVLGPFSALAVIPAVFSLASPEDGDMPQAG